MTYLIIKWYKCQKYFYDKTKTCEGRDRKELILEGENETRIKMKCKNQGMINAKKGFFLKVCKIIKFKEKVVFRDVLDMLIEINSP